MSELITAEKFGLEKTEADNLKTGLDFFLKQRENLINEFNEVSQLEIDESNIPVFKELRLKIVKNRTQGIEKWHKKSKAYFLQGGRFVDAIKNKESEVNNNMEEFLLGAEKHFEKLEQEKIDNIQTERVSLLDSYVDNASEYYLADMEQDVWEAYLLTKKTKYLEKIEAEKKLEAERLAKIEAEKLDRERINKENSELKAKAIEAEKIVKIAKAKADAKLKSEREAKEKIEAELKAKVDAELEAIKKAEILKQKNLEKNDVEKIQDFINDLKKLKTKYVFKSEKNKKTYEQAGTYIDKLINHIKQ